MKHSTRKFLLTLAAAMLLAGCEAEISGSLDDDADPGSADFSTFVALGDSLTAGYKDGALYRDGQETSYPAILAQQFALAGGGAFAQPLMPSAATGSLTAGGAAIPGTNDRLVLAGTGNPEQPVTPVNISPSVPTEVVTVPPLTGPFNNLGVPAAKSFHVVAGGYGNPAGLGVMPPTANPFFVRFASSTSTSMMQDALDQFPTFYIVWIGNNDILLYAIDGGDPAVSGQAVTDVATFQGAYNLLIGNLTAVSPNARGVLVNIPDATTIPYFTTVPFDAIPLTATEANDLMTGLFNTYNALVQGQVGAGACTLSQEEADRRKVNFKQGQNPVLILDETLTDLTPCLGVNPFTASMRQATERDFPVLPTAAKLGTDAGGGLLWGVSAPLEDADVLIEAEVTEIEAARAAYNATIEMAAADPNLVLFDAAAKLKELNDSGISYGSGGVSSTFVEGGFFSADGVHPTARGYAVLANEIMEVIEQGFGAKLPPVDPNQYSTVFFE